MFRNVCVLTLLASLVLVGCRGSDETDIEEPRFPLTTDPDAFAAFLNPAPGVPRDGVAEGAINNVDDFPTAYYNTIDPDATRDSFLKWRIANGFLNADGTEASCDLPNCRSAHVSFRDTKDLGYGRNMFMRRNLVTGDVAVYVENFQVDAVPGVPYGPLNLEALVEGDRQWNFGVNAIEFSGFPYGAGARKFTKFYNFAGDGARVASAIGSQQHFVDLDDRGDKPMPVPCIVCHGGQGRTLVVEGADGRLVLAPTVTGGIPGDVQAQLQMIEVDTLQFQDATGFTRADNEAGLREINAAILSTFEHRAANFTAPGDWDPALAIEIMRGRYGGDPGVTGSDYNGNVVPAGWAGDQTLYRSLVGPNCMVCHALRGSNVNATQSFANLGVMQAFDDRIDHLVFEQGKMPLGLLNYSNMWDGGKNPADLATALGISGRVDADLQAIPPGAPVAVPSVPRVATGTETATTTSYDIPLSGAGSAFTRADGYRWSVSPDTGAEIVNAGPVGDAILRVAQSGDYTVTLTVDGVDGTSDSTSRNLRIDDRSVASAAPPPAEITFFGADGILQWLQGGGGCSGCHVQGGGYDGIPLYYEACRSDNFNGNEYLYRSVLARVNFDSPMDSLLLRKPANGATDPDDLNGTAITGYHAGGNLLVGDNGVAQGRLLAWILSGAPAGEVPDASTIPATAPACLP